MNRRQFVYGFSTLALSAGTLPLPALAQKNFEISSLTDRMAMISGSGSNVVLFRGNARNPSSNQGSITVIDSGTDKHASALVNAIKDWAGNSPVSTLFNTHWHPDHTGGNEELHALGADIIAHENTRLWLTAEFEVQWRNTHYKPRDPAALPDQTFYVSGEKDLGGEIVQYNHYYQAHTDGDIALYFPNSNVLVTGGLMSDGTYPVTDIATGGWLGGLIDANKAMLDLIDENTIVVPESGPARSKADLQAQYDMLADLYASMKSLMQQGYNGQDMLAEKVTAKYDEAWGDPTEFVMETYRGMWAHTSDMGGFI